MAAPVRLERGPERISFEKDAAAAMTTGDAAVPSRYTGCGAARATAAHRHQ
jgi:hypothetical protein